ncbi:MAG TPA: peptide deformylase [Gammaproteobacteria bacterium]|nr:peptide deformylase [Gammaproteobacteria bacterium]
MALLTILHHPDPRLRTRAAPVEAFDATLERLVEDLLETMYAAPGIGLAATQVDVHRRVLVADVSREQDQPICLVNPVLLETVGEEEMEEGCLSVPGVYETVQRADRIRVRAQNVRGEFFEFDADGLLAVCIQHEMDHLEGRLFVDYLSPLKRNRIKRKLEKAQRAAL